MRNIITTIEEIETLVDRDYQSYDKIMLQLQKLKASCQYSPPNAAYRWEQLSDILNIHLKASEPWEIEIINFYNGG